MGSRTRTQIRPAGWLVALALVAAAAPAPRVAAQDATADDALDRLLDQVDSPAPDDPKPPTDESKPTDAPDGAVSDDQAAPKDGSAAPKGDDPPPVVPDEALDGLLEKLGESTDEPEATDRPAPKPPGDAPPPPDQTGEGGGAPEPKDAPPPTPGGVAPDQEGLDRHLEELQDIKRRRPQDPEQSKQDPSRGPLGETIRKMREVEKRLQEQDTGDQTRERQKEIVKQLDQLIQQARSSGSGQSRQRQTAQAGQQPGSTPGNNGTGRGTGPQRPKKPTAQSVLAEGKDEWGHLPPELRGEMENVFKEDALPSRRALIDRYYISVSRKSTTNRGD